MPNSCNAFCVHMIINGNLTKTGDFLSEINIQGSFKNIKFLGYCSNHKTFYTQV